MKHMNNLKRTGLTALCVAISSELYAQSAIEEVIVTAQRREESVQDIPISIDVVTADTLIREGIRDIKDIEKTSTELEINSRNGQATVIGVRGMQQNGFATTGDPLTAVHMDGANLGNFWGLNGLMFDLERIEVLSGPQGTLYGRNTAAGAVNLLSKRPGFDYESNISVEAGNLGTARVEGGITVPFNQSFTMRVSGRKYVRDELFSGGGGKQNQLGLRLSGLWAPDDRNRLFVTVDYADFKSTNDEGTLLGLNTNATLPGGGTPDSITDYLGIATLSDPYNTQAYEEVRGLEFQGYSYQENLGLMAEYVYDFSRTNITAQYSHRKIEGVAYGATKTTAQYIGAISPKNLLSDSVEIRWASTDDSALQWVSGLYWAGGDTLAWQATPLMDSSPDPISGFDVPTVPVSGGFIPQMLFWDTRAIFGQAVWNRDERTRFTVGLRYTSDEKSASLGYVAGNTPIFAFGKSEMPALIQDYFASVPESDGGSNVRNWDGFQWRLGAERDLTDDSMIYGSIATGYKAGGLTYGPTPVLDPEELLAYEFGTKNRFFDRSLQLNAALWWYNYENLEAGVQRPLGYEVVLPSGNIQDAVASTTNVGKVDMGGMSADIDWYATERDQLGFSFTYTYSKIKDGTETLADGTTNIIFNEGERLGDAPEWNLLTRYSHNFFLPNGATLNAGGKYQWRSEKLDQSQYRPQSYYPNHRNPPDSFTIPSIGILDLSLRYQPASGNWDISAYVHNATDELQILTMSEDLNSGNATFGHITGSIGEPRTYGLLLNASF